MLQPASHHSTLVLRACWDLEVLKTYIVTTEDIAMPAYQQDAMIESVRDDTWSVKHFDSSHLPFLSQIEEFFGIT